MEDITELVECKICDERFPDKTDLVEHMRTDHELLEVASFAANVMVQEEERDKAAREFHRRFDHLKKELVSH